MSTKQKRTQKSTLELKIDLDEQIQLLIDGCRRYDTGFELAGKQISTTLRILLHEYRQSRSLLEQLHMRSQKRFMDSAGPIREENLLPEFNLLTWGMKDGKDGFKIFPQCAAFEIPEPRWINFTNWWMDSVIKDSNKKYFSRFDLIQNIANTDGGAHVDPSLNDDYIEFKLSASKTMTAIDLNGVRLPSGKPELACARQIAHEVLITLRRNENLKFVENYAPIHPN